MLSLRALSRVALSSRVRHFHSAPSLCVNPLLSSPPTSSSPSQASTTIASPPPPPPATPPPGYIRVNVDGIDVDVPNGYTVMMACEVAGKDIPRFCYHERLSIAGNCRMCLVEVEKSPKPVASCAMPAMSGQRIKTNSPLVKKAREGVMEFLLNNHPLDCPICDQGGECDLQDQSMGYGSERDRFHEIKRTVEDKNLGPLVKTVMTRCIHCTRCIRYSTEIAGVTILGATGRGQQMEIGTYVGKLLDSEVSGNVVDLCPVGALTSKPYAFQARPWELKHTESIDVHDALGSNIRIDTRGAEVLRILPRLNEEVNEEWIGDKSRYSYDGLRRQRLDIPMIRKGADFVPVTWPEALTAISTQLKSLRGGQVLAVAGDMVDAETLISAKDFFNRLGSSNLTTSPSNVRLPADIRSSYLFNTSIRGIEESDFCLVIGSNPRMEAAVLNTRLRKAVRNFNMDLYLLGPEVDLLTKHTYLGNDSKTLQELSEGKHALISKFQKAKKPMIIIGMSVLRRGDADALLSLIYGIQKHVPNLATPTWNGFNVLHTSASKVGAQDVGFVPGVNAFSQKAKLVYLIGAEEVDEALVESNAFIVYQGHHGDRGAAMANVILPTPAYTEKDATYVNLEGRVQRTQPAAAKLVSAREDWAVFRALSELLGMPLPYNSLKQVRERLVEVAPHFARVDELQPSSLANVALDGALLKGEHRAAPFHPFYNNYFQTDPISRSSRIMARCSAELINARNSYKAALEQAQKPKPRQPSDQEHLYKHSAHIHGSP